MRCLSFDDDIKIECYKCLQTLRDVNSCVELLVYKLVVYGFTVKN